ncbi:MAG: MBL fold metallo-hydrolase [Bacteroidota bacterium]
MHLTVLGSSSKGNGYILHNASEVLLIEAGIHFDKVKQALEFDFSKVKGCLVTHEHKDHSAYMLNYASAGINIFSSALTFEASSSSHHNFNPVNHNKNFTAGNFFITPLRIEHDAAEPFCYIISHPDMGNMLFLTDTFNCRYSFPELKFSHILIEANYSMDIINQNLAAGATRSSKNRILFSHMELGATLSLLRSYVSKLTQNVVLIHLSDFNSNSEQFKAAAEEICSHPAKVFIATPNLSIPINKNPF